MLLISGKLVSDKPSTVQTLEIDLSNLLQTQLVIPSEQAKKLILETLDNKSWLYPQAPKMIKNEVSANPLEATVQLTTNTITNVSS